MSRYAMTYFVKGSMRRKTRFWRSPSRSRVWLAKVSALLDSPPKSHRDARYRACTECAEKMRWDVPNA